MREQTLIPCPFVRSNGSGSVLLPVVATSHPTPTRLLLPARHKVVLVMSLNLAASRACCTCNALQRQRMLQFLCHAHKHTILSLVHSNRIIM